MGRTSYRPKRNNEKIRSERRLGKERMEDSNNGVLGDVEDIQMKLDNDESKDLKKDKTIVISKEVKSKECKSIQNIKEVGNIECEYHVFIEDYVYTYIYQLAKADANKELSAMLVGEVYKASKEAVIRGIIPINMDKLDEGTEWIDGNILDDVETKRVEYFKDQDIIGWMHLQPGYGTMLTMKEQREHSNVFEGDGSICMLIDPINKIESVFVYENEELKEQSGFCMYYERNESMQRYMLEHSFDNVTKEEMKDTIVDQFREIGKVRKAEYTQRKNVNITVMLVSTILIAITACLVKFNDDKRAQNQVQTVVGQELNNVNEPELDTSIKNNNANESGVGAVVKENENNKESQQQSQVENNANLEEVTVEEVVKADESEIESDLKGESLAEKTDVKETVEIEDEIEIDHIYVVKEGQTLANIAYEIYGDAKKSLDIAKFNNLENTNEIYYGQELKIPRID